MTPARYAVGLGARPGVRIEAVRRVLARVAHGHGLDLSVTVFATLATRAREPGLRAAVRSVAGDTELVAWSAEQLAEETVPHPSRRVADVVGTPSVAEAAALRTARLSLGATGADLVVPKVVGDGVTVAVAVAR